MSKTVGSAISSNEESPFINPAGAPEPAGSVARDNTQLENRGEQHGIGNEQKHQLGTGELSKPHIANLSDDSTLKAEQCMARWEVVARLRLKESSLGDSRQRIKRFNRIVGLEKYTKREFEKNRVPILVEYYGKTSKGSWRYDNSKLSIYFKYGLQIEWPEDEIWAFQGKLPMVKQGFEPDQGEVVKWLDAFVTDPNACIKVIIAPFFLFGVRPEHLYKMLMADLRYDESGDPCAIVANGEDRDFKKPEDLAVYLPSWYRDNLKEYLKMRGATKPTDPLFCHLEKDGRLDSTRPLDEHCLSDLWDDFIDDHNRLRKEPEKLVRLVRRDVRHWVCGIQEKIGLSYSASAYMVGHSQRKIRQSYRDYYAHKSVEVALREQEMKIPEGLILKYTTVGTVSVESTEPWHNEWVALGRRFFEKKDLSDLDLAAAAGHLRLEHAERARPQESITTEIPRPKALSSQTQIGRCR